MLSVGVQTAGLLAPHGVDRTFELLRESGFDFVDFSFNALDGSLVGMRDKPDPLTGVYDLPAEEIVPYIEPFRQAAEKNGIAFGQAHAPFPSWWPDRPSRNLYLTEAYIKMIALCEYVGCPYLIIHPAKQPDLNDDWQANMALYEPLIPALKKHHVVCCLENMFTSNGGRIMESSCADPYEACDYIDELNDRAGDRCFGFCLDTGHALLTGRDIYTTIMKLGARTVTLHIHDNDGRGDRHMAPYMGMLDWERFINGIADVGYQGGLSFETFNAMNVFDKELHAPVLDLIAKTGRMFARRIEERRQLKESEE